MLFIVGISIIDLALLMVSFSIRVSFIVNLPLLIFDGALTLYNCLLM